MKSKTAASEDWLKSPIKTEIGTLWLGGFLRGSHSIPTNNMRILGRYALVLVIEGNAYYKDPANKITHLRSGDALFVTPNLPHAYGSRDDRPWSQVYAVFDGPQFDLLQQSPTMTRSQPVWSPQNAESWHTRLKSVLQEPETGQAAHQLRTLGHFVELMIEMLTAKPEQSDPPNDWLKESIRLLGEPQKDGWTAPQAVATQLGFSYENFRKLFTHHTGSPPKKFQRQRKIDRACTAIYQGSSNFKELAESLEFCDVYHFSKAFRQHKGIPPSAYRKTVRGN